MEAIQPLLVNRHEARRLLGGIGDSKLYELMNRGEIEGVFLDNKRLFTYASVKALSERLPKSQPDGIGRRVGNLKYCDAHQTAGARPDAA